MTESLSRFLQHLCPIYFIPYSLKLDDRKWCMQIMRNMNEKQSMAFQEHIVFAIGKLNDLCKTIPLDRLVVHY